MIALDHLVFILLTDHLCLNNEFELNPILLIRNCSKYLLYMLSKVHFFDSYLAPSARTGRQYFFKSIAVPCNAIYKVLFYFENVIDKTMIFYISFYIHLCLNRKSNRLLEPLISSASISYSPLTPDLIFRTKSRLRFFGLV